MKADETICRTNHFTNFAVLMRTNDANFSVSVDLVLLLFSDCFTLVDLFAVIGRVFSIVEGVRFLGGSVMWRGGIVLCGGISSVFGSIIQECG